MRNKKALLYAIGIAVVIGGYYWYVISRYSTKNSQKNNRKIILIGNK
jgi:hypothetical protein